MLSCARPICLHICLIKLSEGVKKPITRCTSCCPDDISDTCLDIPQISWLWRGAEQLQPAARSGLIMIPQPGYFGPGVSNYNVLQCGRNLLLSISSVFATVNSIRENPRLGASCRAAEVRIGRGKQKMCERQKLLHDWTIKTVLQRCAISAQPCNVQVRIYP